MSHGESSSSSSFFASDGTWPWLPVSSSAGLRRHKPEDLLRSVVNDVLRFFSSDENVHRYCPNNTVKPRTPFDFEQGKAPRISIDDYCTRICKYVLCYWDPDNKEGIRCEDHMYNCAAFCLSFVCLMRKLVSASSGKIVPNENNIHRLVATAIYLYEKLNNDGFFVIDYYSKIFGIRKLELVRLEKIMLENIKSDLNCMSMIRATDWSSSMLNRTEYPASTEICRSFCAGEYKVPM